MRSYQEKTCPKCGKIFKRLDKHILGCNPNEEEAETLVIDAYTKEQPLQGLLEQIRDMVKRYKTEMRVQVQEKGGQVREVELVVRFLL